MNLRVRRFSRIAGNAYSRSAPARPGRFILRRTKKSPALRSKRGAFFCSAKNEPAWPGRSAARIGVTGYSREAAYPEIHRSVRESTSRRIDPGSRRSGDRFLARTTRPKISGNGLHDPISRSPGSWQLWRRVARWTHRTTRNSRQYKSWSARSASGGSRHAPDRIHPRCFKKSSMVGRSSNAGS